MHVRVMARRRRAHTHTHTPAGGVPGLYSARLDRSACTARLPGSVKFGLIRTTLLAQPA